MCATIIEIAQFEFPITIKFDFTVRMFLFFPLSPIQNVKFYLS